MKINPTALANFNRGLQSKYNASYNRMHNLPSLVESGLLRKVHASKYGMQRGKISQKDIDSWLECNTYKPHPKAIEIDQR